LDIELDLREASLEDLLSGLRRGDEPLGSRCAEELIRRFTPMLRKLWNRIKLNEPYEDFVQDVFVRLFRHLPKLNNATLFPGYFLRVASSVLIDFQRRIRPSISLDEAELDKIPTEIAAEYEILNGLFVASYLDRLHGKQRRALELLYLEDQSDSAAAEILGLRSSGSVRKLKSQALSELRSIVGVQRVL
jgi:RNA polymerase sigma-70 factor (ECF subfamily)